MMRGAAVQNTQVDVCFCSLREALKEVFDEFGLKIADAGCRGFRFDHAEGGSSKVDGGCGKRFVHRHQEIAGAIDAAFVAESGEHGFTEGDADVFYGMVLV